MSARRKLARAGLAVAVAGLIVLAGLVGFAARKRSQGRRREVPLREHLSDMTFAHDGETLVGISGNVYSSAPDVVSVLDVETTERKKWTCEPGSRVVGIAHAGNHVLATSRRNTVQIVPLLGPESAYVVFAHLTPFDTQFSADDSRVLLRFFDRLEVRSVADGRLCGNTIHISEERIWNTGLSPDGSRVWWSSRRGAINMNVRSLEDGTEKRFTLGVWSAFGFTHHNELIAFQSRSNDRGGCAEIWSAIDGTPLRPIVAKPFDRAWLAARGERLLVQREGELEVLDLDTGRSVFRTPIEAKVAEIAISPRGDRIAAVRSDGRAVDVWDIP